MEHYLVYMHISPQGKKYVGLTKRSPTRRWGNQGRGYYNNRRPETKQSHFWYAIKKYGWDNFEHIIVKDNLSKEEAKELEQKLIKDYKTNNEEFGYNLTSGGDGVRNFVLSQESKDKISNSLKNKYKNGEIVNPRLGKHLTEQTKEKLRSINLGKKYSQEVKDKHKKPAWNKGIPMTEEAKQHLREVNLGKKASEETKHKISLSRNGKKLPPAKESTKQKLRDYFTGTIWVTNGEHSKQIKPEQLQAYFDLGYVKGRKKIRIN